MGEALRFALVNNERVDAAPELKGLCPGCSQPVVAKCGTRRIWHWAHRAERICDRWWEPETEWHRAWKNNFANEWQESIRFDQQTGEKHIADVYTEHGLVIEFQHSHLKPEERAARERFYQNMVWVVDGTRLKRDYPRFQKGWDNFRQLNKAGFFCVHFPDECFPADWLNSSVPVIFDFQGVAPIDPPDRIRDTLWCLLPGRAENCSVVVGIFRGDFVTTVAARAQLLPAKEIVDGVAQNIRQQREAERVRMMSPPRYTQRRRYRRF